MDGADLLNHVNGLDFIEESSNRNDGNFFLGGGVCLKAGDERFGTIHVFIQTQRCMRALGSW